MAASPLLHLCLHLDSTAIVDAGRSAGRDVSADPVEALATWVRRDAMDGRGLSGSRVLGVAMSIGLHVAALALFVGAAAPNLPIALGESEIDTLEIEFLPPALDVAASVPVPTVPKLEATPVPTPPPSAAITAPVEPERVPPPEPVVVASADIAEPVAAPATAAMIAAPIAEAAPPQTPAPERPLSARGKRAQSQYLRELMAWLARHRVYPSEAKKHKLEGVVQVRFAIDRDGHLLSAVVHRSAGTDVLDRAALDVLRRADPMPKFPKALERRRLSVTLPIDFSLIND